MSGWQNEAHIERLKVLWDSGLSANQTAQTLNREFADARYTRNAVIGKVGRLHLPQRSLSAQRAAVSIANKARAKPTGWQQMYGKPKASPYGGDPTTPPHVKKLDSIKANIAARLEPALPKNTDAPGSRTILTVRHGECRWPIGDPQHPTFTLCGCKAEKGPYCEAHSKRAYVAPANPNWTPEMREAAAQRARRMNAARRTRAA
jgi:GcrA cell cycle regulator